MAPLVIIVSHKHNFIFKDIWAILRECITDIIYFFQIMLKVLLLLIFL